MNTSYTQLYKSVYEPDVWLKAAEGKSSGPPVPALTSMLQALGSQKLTVLLAQGQSDREAARLAKENEEKEKGSSSAADADAGSDAESEPDEAPLVVELPGTRRAIELLVRQMHDGHQEDGVHVVLEEEATSIT